MSKSLRPLVKILLFCICFECNSIVSLQMSGKWSADPKTQLKTWQELLRDQRKEDRGGVLTVTDFPSQSPQHLWGHIKIKKANHRETSQKAWWNTVKACWDNVSPQASHKLVGFMRAWVHVVINAKAGQTNTKIFWNSWVFFKDSIFHLKM